MWGGDESISLLPDERLLWAQRFKHRMGQWVGDPPSKHSQGASCSFRRGVTSTKNVELLIANGNGGTFASLCEEGATMSFVQSKAPPLWWM